MAWYMPQSGNYSSAYNLPGLDNVFIAQQVFYSGRIEGSTNYHEIIVAGTIANSTADSTFSLGSPFNGGNNNFTIETTGQVRSFGGTAIAAYGESHVTNAGLIAQVTATGVGAAAIYFRAVSASGLTSTLNNTGTVSATGYGVYHHDSAEPLTVKNYGSITGKMNSFFANGGAVDKIYNYGMMKGAIELAGGNDLYDGSKGHHVTGVIDGGEGSDTIKGGAEADTIHGGYGADLLTGGAGKDTFRFWSSLDSGTTSATRDVITDFKAKSDKIDVNGIDAMGGENGQNQDFIFDAARSTSTKAVAEGHLAWYWVDKAGTANDQTIIKMNLDSDPAIEATIALKGLITLTSVDFIL